MAIPWPIVAFFILHWQVSVFFQTFFLHRYGAHRMFTMSHGWERFFHLCTYLSQGSSFLNPRGYAILHRMHHAYSDTEQDPHSPVIWKNPLSMMNHTRDVYRAVNSGTMQPEARFEGGYPSWPALDRLAHSWTSSVLWGAGYALFYLYFHTAWWQLLLVPFHWFMGPVHGAIVNWFGHWSGYRNFKTADASRNSLPFDFVTMGELFQNNHHTFGMRPNFAVKWFEIDPAWIFIRVLSKLGIIELRAKDSGGALLQSAQGGGAGVESAPEAA